MKYLGLAVGLLALTATACRGSSDTADAPGLDGSGAIDAMPTADAPFMTVDDGTPTRLPACTNQLGSSLTQTFGRLDGFLVAIVQPGAHTCNGDTDHMHLQVRANGAVYDIAVNVGSATADDVHTMKLDLALPAWSEGWHPAVVDDYVARGIHSTAIPLEPRAQVASDLNADLATANHITVFATGYGPDGAHLVHRNGNGHDGLVVTDPLSTPSHARVFSFSTQTF